MRQSTMRCIGTTVLTVAVSGWLARSAPAAVVISEIMYDTQGTESGTNFGEWIELFNSGPLPVDLTGWSVEKDGTIDGAGVDVLTLVQGPAVIGPGQFALIFPGGSAAPSTAPLLEAWTIAPTTTVYSCDWAGSHNLGNAGETIVLRDSLATAVDIATYPDLGTNVGSIQVAVSALTPATNDVPANWVQSTEANAEYCVDPVSAGGADFGYFDDGPANDYWDEGEARDLGTPARFPTDLKYAARYAVDYGVPLVQTQASVEAMIATAVILPSANAAELCSYDFSAPFPAGTRIRGAGGSAPHLILPATTWVAWIDDDPLSNFTHPTRIVLVDDASGTVAVVNSGWWLEINDEPFFNFEETRNCSPNAFAGNCCTGPGFEYPLDMAFRGDISVISRSAHDRANMACVIAVSGSSESHFTKNVDNFTKALQDKGLAKAGRTTKVKHPNSRLTDVCKAFDNLPADCDKLYVYVASHGSHNSIALPGTNLSAKKLACKIKAKNVPNNCIVLQACRSGSSIDELKGKKIPGFVTTSADSTHSSYFLRDKYSYYTQYIIDCLKLGDITDLKEAAAWAKQQLKKNRKKDKSNPQCADLTATGVKQEEGAEAPSQRIKGQGVNYQFESEGAPPGPQTWVLDPPGLPPPGLTLDSSGLLFGTLIQAGQFDFSVRLFDCCSTDGYALPFTLQVLDPFSTAPPLTVDAEMPPALVNAPYHFPIAIEGGNPPYQTQIVHGTLPPGFTMQPMGPNAGTIFGFSEAEFHSALTIQVQDSGVPPQLAIRNLDIDVVAANPRPSSYADIDYDGDVDPDDWALMADCMTGPVNAVPVDDLNAECFLSDMDGDLDIDLQDAAFFSTEAQP